MRAITFSEYGTLDVLQLKDVEKPVPKEAEVLIKVHAAAVNDWEEGLYSGKPYFMRHWYGWMKPKRRFQIPGCDVAGTIEAIGTGVTKFQPGDEVFGDLCVSGFGSFAEYVCAPETALALKSKQMTFVQAASFPQAAQLMVQGLIDVGKLQAGQKLLINGAGGGVGTFGVQIAKQIGAEVTVVDSGIKLDMLSSLGADHVIDYTKEDFTRNGMQYDLILDTKTSRSAFDYIRALSPTGIYATVGGSMPRYLQALLISFPLSLFSKKKIFVIAQKPNKDLAYMTEMFESGKVKPIIDGPYALDKYREAMAHFLKAEHKGKVIINMV